MQKYRVLKGGETCQAINPHEKKDGIYTIAQSLAYSDFDRANPILPLTHQQDEGIEVELNPVPVWQYREYVPMIDAHGNWTDSTEAYCEKLSKSIFEIRIAYQPITTNSKEEKLPYVLDRAGKEIASASIETNRISEFKRILNEHFEPDSQTPLFACIALSCDEKEILSLMDKAAHWQSQTTQQLLIELLENRISIYDAAPSLVGMGIISELLFLISEIQSTQKWTLNQ